MLSNSLLREDTSRLCFCGSVSETLSRQTGNSLVMEQDITGLTGEEYTERISPCCSDSETLSQRDTENDDILELNQFDGLPYSSRFYKLLRERKELPVWDAKCEFMDILAKGRFVIVSGSAKTGRSSQVSTAGCFTLYIGNTALLIHAETLYQVDILTFT